MSFAPRILRMSHAPAYLGMCRGEFNRCVRPHVSEFPIGVQGIGFDREELDEWANQYIVGHAIDKPQLGQEDGLGNERPIRKGGNKWGVKPSVACTRERESGMSTSRSRDSDEFVKALELVRGKGRKIPYPSTRRNPQSKGLWHKQNPQLA